MHVAGRGYPELLTKCTGHPALGPINPIRNSTFELLQTLFTELASVFPDTYLHVGGDEVRARLTPAAGWQGSEAGQRMTIGPGK